jgi:hypothetical protein
MCELYKVLLQIFFKYGSKNYKIILHVNSKIKAYDSPSLNKLPKLSIMMSFLIFFQLLHNFECKINVLIHKIITIERKRIQIEAKGNLSQEENGYKIFSFYSSIIPS